MSECYKKSKNKINKCKKMIKKYYLMKIIMNFMNNNNKIFKKFKHLRNL
jgi:hypothetical protein